MDTANLGFLCVGRTFVTSYYPLTNHKLTNPDDVAGKRHNLIKKLRK
jgi:hypothetical protein